MFVFASLNHTSLSPSVMFSDQQICQGQTGLVDHVHRGTLQLCVWVSTVTGSNNNWRFAASCLMLAESVLVRRGRWFILNINLLKHCIGTKTKGSINTVCALQCLLERDWGPEKVPRQQFDTIHHVCQTLPNFLCPLRSSTVCTEWRHCDCAVKRRRHFAASFPQADLWTRDSEWLSGEEVTDWHWIEFFKATEIRGYFQTHCMKRKETENDDWERVT